ncbi:hypothetical protein V6N12_012824 [Hibiscus sabdariffa]|uniref:Uncharacterized protein n=1 Tax=Hibiscus sabdariffa TaxID=183260 RepID=A0ABR2EFI7_9ROSI
MLPFTSGLELLDMSGSSITDSDIGMICNVFSNTLSICLCPNIISSGIQFATAQLPLLKLMDCGMTICYLDSQNPPLKVSGNNEPPNALNYVQKSIR